MKLIVLPSEDGITRLCSEGEITLLEVQGRPNPLDDVLGRDGFRRTVLLSLEQSCFIDSAGIGWLLLAHRRFADAGGLLVVHSLPPLVNHSFRLLEIRTILRVADDEAGALRLARGEPALPLASTEAR